MDAWPATNPFASVVAVGAMLPRVVLPPPPPPPLLLLLPPQLTLVPKATASTNVDRATTQRWRTGNRSKSNKKSARDAHTPAASQFGVCGVGARGKVTLCVGVVKSHCPAHVCPGAANGGVAGGGAVQKSRDGLYAGRTESSCGRRRDGRGGIAFCDVERNYARIRARVIAPVAAAARPRILRDRGVRSDRQKLRLDPLEVPLRVQSKAADGRPRSGPRSRSHYRSGATLPVAVSSPDDAPMTSTRTKFKSPY